jgi:hypothetical protein
MFYCDPCRVQRKWPESHGRSLGKCEVCGDVATCNDQPSTSLPCSEVDDAKAKTSHRKDGWIEAIKTRSLAAITLTFDPTTDPIPSEREATVARNYRKDVAALIDHVLELRRQLAEAHDLLRAATHNPAGGERASGRTTRMLLRGLIALSEGHRVMVIGATASHGKNLAATLMARAKEWGIPIDMNNAIVVGAGSKSDVAGFRGVTLIDHTVVDHAS